jgi:hypothetical protein
MTCFDPEIWKLTLLTNRRVAYYCIKKMKIDCYNNT